MSISTQLEDHSGKENTVWIPQEIKEHLPALGAKPFKLESMVAVVNSTPQPYGRVVMNLVIAVPHAGIALVLDPLAAKQLGNELVSAAIRAEELAAETATPDASA